MGHSNLNSTNTNHFLVFKMIMSNPNQHISCEFFPPRTLQGREKLFAVRRTLSEKLNPDFFSVTYGAGGSTREFTRDIVLNIHNDGASVAPHLSFGGDTEESVEELLRLYQSSGIDRLVALRGDIPSGMGAAAHIVYASELVSFIREKTGDHFQIEVAAYPEIHPQATSYSEDIRYLKAKLDAGANSAITQYFYNADCYEYFIEACAKAGIDKPIYPGIMPIINYDNLARFSKNCGAEIPRWMHNKLSSYGNDTASITQFGNEIVTRLCEKLLALGAPGLHFYTMNRAEPTIAICESLGFVAENPKS
jgi:methylenetetrahydrofolate reductase (NADPH)